MDRCDELFTDLIKRYPILSSVSDSILKAFELLCSSVKAGGKILVCGNGGSAADSEHIVGELMKGFLQKRPLRESDATLFKNMPNAEYLINNLQGAIPAISLVSQSALMTAFANDVAADMVFAQQVYVYSKNSSDILIALSTSGNSKNIVNAAAVSKAIGINSICICGSEKGKLNDICSVTINIPERETYKVQELTLPIYHTLCAMLEYKFFVEI